jgi:hypothetical protein
VKSFAQIRMTPSERYPTQTAKTATRIVLYQARTSQILSVQSSSKIKKNLDVNNPALTLKTLGAKRSSRTEKMQDARSPTLTAKNQTAQRTLMTPMSPSAQNPGQIERTESRSVISPQLTTTSLGEQHLSATKWSRSDTCQPSISSRPSARMTSKI